MRKHTIGLLFAACAFIAPARAATTIELESDDAPVPTREAANAPDSRHRSLTLVLGARSFVVRSADETWLYDLDARKRIRFDPATKTRVEYSLFDVVGFRMLELQNRNAMSKGLGAAGIDKAPTATDNENDLGIQLTASRPLQVAVDGNDDTWSTNGRIIGRLGRDGTPVSEDVARMFAMSMRYVTATHPQIVAAIAAARRIPSRFVSSSSGPPHTTTMVVRSVKAGDDAPIDVASYPLRDPAADSDAVEAVLDRAAALTAGDRAAALRANEADTTAAFRDGRVLEALLAAVERNLMTGEGLTTLTDAQKAILQRDAAAQRYLAVIGAKDKASLAAAIAVLEELRPQAGARAHVIDLAIANDRAALGDRDTARRMFVAVLQADPCLASAYKDLGDALLGAWDVPRAWRSWDAGRRIAPRFPTFVAIERFERSLAADHPEFFDPTR